MCEHEFAIKHSEKIARALILFVETFDCEDIGECKDCLLSVEYKSPDGNEDHDYWDCVMSVLKRRILTDYKLEYIKKHKDDK